MARPSKEAHEKVYTDYHVKLTKEVSDAIRELARRRGIPQASLVREVVSFVVNEDRVLLDQLMGNFHTIKMELERDQRRERRHENKGDYHGIERRGSTPNIHNLVQRTR